MTSSGVLAQPHASRLRNTTIPSISAIAAYIANTPNPVQAENTSGRASARQPQG